MSAPKVFIVHLRRPNRNDQRTDPLYEFGSFGCTKCHRRNLMNPRNANQLEGGRLAFLQGGSMGSRLVLLTPPIRIRVWANCCEATWQPCEMPFKYSKAPVLASNGGAGDFPSIRRLIRKSQRPTPEGALSSFFRSRTKPLEPKLAAELIAVYEHHRGAAAASDIATTYDEALPRTINADRSRKATYKQLVRALRAEIEGPVGKTKSGCISTRKRRTSLPGKRCK